MIILFIIIPISAMLIAIICIYFYKRAQHKKTIPTMQSPFIDEGNMARHKRVRH
jgi:hypothetical protein